MSKGRAGNDSRLEPKEGTTVVNVHQKGRSRSDGLEEKRQAKRLINLGAREMQRATGRAVDK